MDQGHDRAEIFGQDARLNLISSGHYRPPNDKTENIPVEAVCAVKLDNISEAKRQNVLLKLHRLFAQLCKRRLIALLKDAGVLIDFSLTVKAATSIFISGHGSAISSAREGKSGFIYNLVKI